jgi:rubrerythrin
MPMAFRTTRELFNQIESFHRQLGDLYARMAAKAGREKVKALLEYMSRHQQRLEKNLTAYEKDAAERVLNTWFEFTPDIAKCECFDGIELREDMSVGDVVRTALWFDDCLVQLFTEMTEISVSEDVKELFANLARMEEQEKREVTRASLEVTEGV